MSRAESDAKQGTWGPRDLLVPYVLLAISAQRAHGYYIEQYLRGLGLAQVEMSRLYRTLRQLEKQGLVTSMWEAGEGGPARRTYALTDAGRVWLRSGASMLEGYRAAIDAFFGRYEPRPARPREERPEPRAARPREERPVKPRKPRAATSRARRAAKTEKKRRR